MNRRFATLCLLLVTAALSSSLSASADGKSDWTVLPTHRIKVPVKGVELYQLDNAPLAGRKPLLLVHGLLGENWPLFRWGDVTRHLIASKDFNGEYKIYLARYDTVAPLAGVIEPFRQSVRKLYSDSGNRPISILALSMGGNVVQESMADSGIDRSIDKVLTMGTPFHGSPLFTYDWMQYGFLQNHRVPWVKADLFMSYHLYFSKHQNLLSDLRWDNVDKNIPDVGKFNAHVPWRVRGDLTPAIDGNPHIVAVNAELETDKSKFITYGGYLVAPWANADRPSLTWQASRLPAQFVGTTVPFHFGREHPVLRVLNREISWVPPGSNGTADSRGTSRKIMYGLNDGITPVASALFLPAKTFKDDFCLSESDVLALSKFVDVRKARVFRNIDHLTYIDGYRPRRASKLLRDELHPRDGERDIFDWILADVLDQDVTLPVAVTPAAAEDAPESAITVPAATRAATAGDNQ